VSGLVLFFSSFNSYFLEEKKVIGNMLYVILYENKSASRTNSQPHTFHMH
jgi:hypothetical protein